MTKKYTFADILNNDIRLELAKTDELLLLLNLDPPQKYLEIYNGLNYLPIGIIEMLLTKIFQNWRVEVLREGQLLNSVYAAVRLHYCHPLLQNGLWQFQDGLGAKNLQLEKGHKASDMSAISHMAVMMALPTAESFAIKDAADKIGKLFGRDLNREHVMNFSPVYDTKEFREAQEAKKLAIKEKLHADR